MRRQIWSFERLFNPIGSACSPIPPDYILSWVLISLKMWKFEFTKKEKMHLQITNLNEAGKFKSKRHVWTTNIPIIAQIDKYKTIEIQEYKKDTNANCSFFWDISLSNRRLGRAKAAGVLEDRERVRGELLQQRFKNKRCRSTSRFSYFFDWPLLYFSFLLLRKWAGVIAAKV